MHKIKENALSSIRIDDLFLFVVFNLLLFQPFLERFSDFAGYIDEIAFLSLLLLTAISARSRKYGQFRRVDKVILVLMVVVALLGIMGNYAAGVQLGLSPILTDVFACFKVPLALLGALEDSRRRDRLPFNRAFAKLGISCLALDHGVARTRQHLRRVRYER